MTYATASTTATTATATAATASATSRGTAAGTFRTRTLTISTLCLLTSRLRLASELNGDLTLEDLLAGELLDSALGFRRGGEIDKSVANRAVGTRVLGNRNRLAISKYISTCLLSQLTRSSKTGSKEEVDSNKTTRPLVEAMNKVCDASSKKETMFDELLTCKTLTHRHLQGRHVSGAGHTESDTDSNPGEG